MRRLVLVSLFLLLCSGLVRAEEPVVIGLMSTLTGVDSSFGQDCRVGYEVARRVGAPQDRLGERSLRFIYADTQSDNRVAASEAQKLIAVEKAVALVNRASQTSMVINPLSQRYHVPLLGVAGVGSFLSGNPYAFRFWPPNREEGAALSSAAISFGDKNSVSVTLESEYSDSLRESFREAFLADGGNYLRDIAVAGDETDFRAVVSRLLNIQPEVIFANVGAHQLGPLVKQLKEQGYSRQIFGNIWVQSKDFLSYAQGVGLDGVIFAQLDTEKPLFLHALQEFDRQAVPSAVMYSCFAAVEALFAAIKDTPPPITSESLFEALRRMSSIALPDETLPFVGREALFTMRLKVFKGGKPVDWRPGH